MPKQPKNSASPKPKQPENLAPPTPKQPKKPALSTPKQPKKPASPTPKQPENPESLTPKQLESIPQTDFKDDLRKVLFTLLSGSLSAIPTTLINLNDIQKGIWWIIFTFVLGMLLAWLYTDKRNRKIIAGIILASIFILIVAYLVIYVSTPLSSVNQVKATISAIPTEYQDAIRPTVYINATSTMEAKSTQVAQIIRDKHPPLCTELIYNGGDITRITNDYKSILWGWWISLIFFLCSVVAFAFTLKANLYRFRFGTMVFVAISLILVLFFSWFNNYPFSLTHSQILDLSKDTDYSTELGSQCATKINIPLTLTPTHTFVPTSTLIPIVAPKDPEAFMLTSTPTLPNYSLYTPRKEPADKQEFAFRDDFSAGDINNWFFSPRTQDVSMQIVKNALQVKLGRNYNGNHFLAGCTGEDCLIQPSYDGDLSVKFRLRAIQDSNNVQAGIAFGSSKILDDTNGYYLLLASNQGQIRFYSSFETLDLHNQTYKLYQIPPNGTVTLQIDFYKDCPNNTEQCALLFVNDTLITGTPLEITAPPYGYFGVFVLPGNTQGYIELITYEYIKAWYAP